MKSNCWIGDTKRKPSLDNDRDRSIGMPVVPHPNERVELAIRILDCRQKLRRVGWDLEQAEALRAEMERLARKLREIDE